MYKTHVRPVRDIRNNYAELDKIVNNHDHVIITNNGRGTAALIGIEEYAMYEQFLRSHAGNQIDGESSKEELYRLLAKGRADVTAGRTRPHNEVMADIRRRIADGSL